MLIFQREGKKKNKKTLHLSKECHITQHLLAQNAKDNYCRLPKSTELRISFHPGILKPSIHFSKNTIMLPIEVKPYMSKNEKQENLICVKTGEPERQMEGVRRRKERTWLKRQMVVDSAIVQKVLKLHYRPVTLRMFTKRIKTSNSTVLLAYKFQNSCYQHAIC